MALTPEALSKYFETSERKNLLQRRIKEYVALLQEKYVMEASQRYSALALQQRQEMPDTTWHGKATFPLSQATVGFEWYVRIEQPSRLPNCRFSVRAENNYYALVMDQLPSDLVEPMYEALSQFTTLIGYADKALSKNIEDEILSFLRKS